MTMLKCTLAGLLFLVVFVLIAIVVVMVFVQLVFKPEPRTAIGFDLVSIMRSFPVLWLVPALVFLLAFFWEFRRLRSR